ncbi:MAG: hypothetical protein ACK4F9_03305 [Brevinematia bacterium]
MRVYILVFLFLVFIVDFSSGFLLEFKEVDASYVSNIVVDIYKGIQFGDLKVSSPYIDSFVDEYFGMKDFSSYFVLSNTNFYFKLVSKETNIVLRRLPIPILEGIEVLFLLGYKDYLYGFSKFGVADYGNTKVLKLAYNPNSFFLLYISQGVILRVDYWIKEKQNEIMVWSYLCAYSERKYNNKTFLSGVLFNIQSKEFYKFDFDIVK